MTPEDLRTKIANLKSENASDLTKVEDLMSQRDSYSAMSLYF